MDLEQHLSREDFGLFPAVLAGRDRADRDGVNRWEADHVPADTMDEGRSGSDVRPLLLRAWSVHDRAATRQLLGSPEDL